MSPRTTHYSYFPLRDIFRLLAARKGDMVRVQQLLTEYFEKPVVLLNSARAGIHIALQAYGLSRLDEVWVPPFMSLCVLDTIARTAVPSLGRSPRTRAALLVHQWGYPQRLERVLPLFREDNLLVVEDCAFSFASAYQGRRVGGSGHAAVYCFPKVFPTILGGCLVTEDEKILRFAHEYLERQNALSWRLFSDLALLPMMLRLGTRDGKLNAVARHWLESWHTQYVYFPNPNKRVCHLFPRDQESLEAGFRARSGNLEIFRKFFLGRGYPAELEADSEVVPYLVPYLAPPPAMERVMAALQRIGVETDIYHFDVQRNMAAYDYQKCVAVPVHQGISAARMREICGAIAGAATPVTLGMAAKCGYR